jgi:hypothetical protein
MIFLETLNFGLLIFLWKLFFGKLIFLGTLYYELVIILKNKFFYGGVLVLWTCNFFFALTFHTKTFFVY